MAGIVFNDVADDTDVQGTLFQGIKFWISHKVPQRSRFLSNVKANGGEILPLEKNADVKIVDHARKETPPGSHSYTFIEKSIRNGVLEDLDDHKVGPPEGNIRSIGSVAQPAKGTRKKYTEADDRILLSWVNDNRQKGGGTDGNEIYKQLEIKHPHHPWQSWRDRWIKYLKGRAAPFALPHNAPPTPPFDVPATYGSSKNPATTSDTADDDYQSFADDDAEALMVNGDDILNIHPENITEAWKSWTRDHDDDVHTAQQWQSYWEKRVRPRYLKRKAKETRRTSPEKSIPARSQIPLLPKRFAAATPSAFSPFKGNYTLIPKSPRRTMSSQFQNSTSPKSSMAAVPSALSPVSRPDYSLIPDSPQNTVSFGVQKSVLPKRSVVVPPPILLPSVESHHSLKPTTRSPSYHPESPTITATAPPIHQKATDILSKHMPIWPSDNERHTQVTPEKTHSPYHETLKRKYVAIEEDLPSSSPLGPISPKRRRPSASELPLEIASTPEKHRELDNEGSFSPLFINLELEEDEPSIPEDSTENDSLLGQQLSDTLSEPSRVVNNTQAVFGDATQLIDFDVPAPEGGWDNEELVVQNRSQPVDFDIPSPEDGREDNKQGIRESAQLIDFDLLPPEGGWDEEGPPVKEESESPNTETYDPQPNLPDTQAILRSKTPAPDFSIPDPDGGWNSLIASSPPLMPNSPRAESEFSQTDLKDQMDAWIDGHATKGISVEQVESVLKSTSMDTALAHKALRHLAKKGALPEDWRGVWTDSDDEDLKSTDARNIQRLQEKHGADCLAARWQFLDFYAE
ncbi:MAG: hypothetical protein ASARMPREDX12_001547 [Alectoria sarmentosa]|nr:MAG: hypothetical protein ASARMPREDX12_001547 [Alectoria sarmentosa]